MHEPLTTLPSLPPISYPVTPSPPLQPEESFDKLSHLILSLQVHSPRLYAYKSSLSLGLGSLLIPPRFLSTLTYYHLLLLTPSLPKPSTKPITTMPFIYPSYRYRSYLPHPIMYNNPMIYGGMGMGMSMPINLGMGMGMGIPYPVPTAVPVPISNPVPVSVPVPIPASAPVYGGHGQGGYGMTAPPLQYQVCPPLIMCMS